MAIPILVRRLDLLWRIAILEGVKSIPATLSLLLLIGCATPQAATTTASNAKTEDAKEEVSVADDLGVRCYNVKPVGSRIPQRKCTTREDRETARVNHRRMMNQSLRSVDAPKNPTE